MSNLLIYFDLIVIVLIGCISIEIKKITNLPYTPIIMFFGIIFGYFLNDLSFVLQGFKSILSLNPYGLLYIFIPALIFDTSFNLDHYVFKTQFYQVVLLAGPGVILGIFVISFIFLSILNYYTEFSLIDSFIFSSIFCSTDTVAVLALFKELGTSRKFSGIVKGENLINDGTSMTFYLFFSLIKKGKSVGITGGILNFIRLSIGGPLFGYLMSFFFILWIKKITKDKTLMIIITISACYLTFILSEMYLEVSGILSIVALGLNMGYVCQGHVDTNIMEEVKIVWEFIVNILEISLFYITGLFIGDTLQSFDKLTIDYNDVYKVFYFFILINLARFLIVLVLFPILNRIGEKLSIKDYIILSYSGLRGGIALSFGLVVFIDNDYTIRFREIVLFFMAGTVALTILFNGFTIKYLMRLINFEPKTQSYMKIQNHINKMLYIKMLQTLDSLKKMPHYRLMNEFEVIKQIDLINLGNNILSESKRINIQNDEIKENELLEEARRRIYMLIKQGNYNNLQVNDIDNNAYYEIDDIINFCLDNCNTKLSIYKSTRTKLLNIENINYIIKFENIYIINRYLNTYLIDSLTKSYNILTQIIQIIKNIIAHSYKIPISEKIIFVVLKELKNEVRLLEKKLSLLEDLFPNLFKHIQIKLSAINIISEKQIILQSLLNNGVIDNKEYEHEKNIILNNLSNIRKNNFNNKQISFNILNLVFEGFDNLSEDIKSFIELNKKEIYYKENQFILKEGQYSNGVVIIESGIIEEKIGIFNDRYTFGSLLTYGNLFFNGKISISTLKCISNTKVIYLDNDVIYEIINKNRKLKEIFYKKSIICFMKYYKYDIYLNDICHFENIINNSSYYELNCNDSIILSNGGFLIDGEIELMQTDKNKLLTFNYPTIINPNIEFLIKGNTASKVIKFNDQIEFENNKNKNMGSFCRNSVIEDKENDYWVNDRFKTINAKINKYVNL